MSEFDSKSEFTVGRWRVNALRGSLTDGEETHHLEPKVMDVLVFLARHSGEVVERDTISAEVWRGRFVSDDPLSRCIAELRRILGDSARNPTYIHTIHKRGYRLVAPVGGIDTPKVARPRFLRHPAAIAILAPVVVVAAFGIAVFQSDDTPPAVMGPLTIAVLPFQDLSVSGENETFSDALSEMLIHQLAQLDTLQVIARNSSFAFKGQNVDVRAVGHALTASNVIEGSVQRSNGEFRITVQLIDANSGVHVWSKIYAPVDTDLFAAQDEVARHVAAEVSNSLLDSDRSAASFAATGDLDAYELYLLGRQNAQGPKAVEAVAFFEHAIEKDPDFALAHAGLADALLQLVRNKDTADYETDTIDRARKVTDRALELSPNLAEAYASRILLANYDNDLDAARHWFHKATSSNPGHAPAYVRYGDALQRSGWLLLDNSLLEEADAVLKRATTLDPLNARLKQRIVMLSHLRGDADAIGQATEDYRSARSRSEAAIALNTLAEITADRGILDQAIAYLQLSSEISGRETGELNLELAGHYLQLQDYTSAEKWLDRVPRPLDWTGLLQLGMLYLETGRLDDFEKLLVEVTGGAAEDIEVSVAEGEMYALMMSGNPLDCARIFELSGRVDMDRLRSMFVPTADMLLSLCYNHHGNRNLALEHRQIAVKIAEKMEEFGGRDAFTLYSIAAAKSLAGDTAAALDFLEHSYDRGACFLGVIERDPFLVNLHDLDRYQRLLADFRSNIERMRRTVYRAKTSDDWYGVVNIERRTW